MKSKLPLLFLFLILAATGFTVAAKEQAITTSEAVAIAERGGGKAVNVKTVNSPEGKQYRIRVLQRDGRVKTITVDATPKKRGK